MFCRESSATLKKREKSTPVCFALVPLSDVFKHHDPSRSRRRFEHEVALVRVNSLRGKAAMASRKHETPKLVLRLHPPEETPAPLAPQMPTSKTPPQADEGTRETAMHDPCHASPGSDEGSDTVVPTDCEAGPSSSPIPKAKTKVPAFKAQANLRKRSVDTEAARASTPIPRDVYVPSQPERPPTSESPDRQEERSLSSRRWLQFAESCVNYIGPYDELREAEEQSDDRRAEVVLKGLLTEWQSVGQMVSLRPRSASRWSMAYPSHFQLVGLATINAAIIGFQKGSTLFSIDDFSLGTVTIGAIAGGLGMAIDAWFFLLFSGADVARFKVRLSPHPHCRSHRHSSY